MAGGPSSLAALTQGCTMLRYRCPCRGLGPRTWDVAAGPVLRSPNNWTLPYGHLGRASIPTASCGALASPPTTRVSTCPHALPLLARDGTPGIASETPAPLQPSLSLPSQGCGRRPSL